MKSMEGMIVTPKREWLASYEVYGNPYIVIEDRETSILVGDLTTTIALGSTHCWDKEWVEVLANTFDEYKI